MDDLKGFIREVPDFPKAGILFYDITTLLKDPLALRMTVDRFVWQFASKQVDKVVGMESRGFMFGPIVAYNLNAGFVPVRKPGKLPATSISETYDLEYGQDTLQMHEDAIESGDRVLIVDDLIATGGTASASAKLVEQRGGKVVGLGFVIELTFLAGRKKLGGYEVLSLIRY
ncbi:MAG TPA: adenine phosphoribosyltransferase [Thermoanaerobaculia bacterium]|jgi:adenine phosphoribosyltransferase|nr:adenine phosphoribosyltransferase [Thermoanaerobaculia bacterium]